MKRAFILLFALSITIQVNATTYYSVSDGNWTGAIWSSSGSTGAGSTLPTLVAGDIVVIDDQVTISSGALTINPAITIIVRNALSPNTSTNPAKLIFSNGGKLVLTSAGSRVVLENVTGNPSNNPQIDGTGNGGSNLIDIGGVEYWRASDGDVIGVGTLQPNGTLPIKLISFVVAEFGSFVELKWVTAMEKNFSHFELERSNGNLSFTSIGRIDGKGGLEVITSYTYIDTLLETGKIYYRLKFIDHDLSYEYSPVVVVESKIEKDIFVYPNPSVGGTINIRANFSPQEGDRIEIYNVLGIKLQEFAVTEYENVLLFNNSVKQGSYLLRYVSPTYSRVVRFNSN